jgi:hypothetical protein
MSPIRNQLTKTEDKERKKKFKLKNGRRPHSYMNTRRRIKATRKKERRMKLECGKMKRLRLRKKLRLK